MAEHARRVICPEIALDAICARGAGRMPSRMPDRPSCAIFEGRFCGTPRKVPPRMTSAAIGGGSGASPRLEGALGGQARRAMPAAHGHGRRAGA